MRAAADVWRMAVPVALFGDVVWYFYRRSKAGGHRALTAGLAGARRLSLRRRRVAVAGNAGQSAV
eukprot:1192378-Prorocentrum_minimum.AAC.2